MTRTKQTYSLSFRFVLYAALTFVTCVVLLLLLLRIFGVLDPVNPHIQSYLENELDNQVAQIVHDVNDLAAYSLEFSKQLESDLEKFLLSNSMSFSDLENNVSALVELQKLCYPTVYTNVRIASCSGAFYILNTTVNSSTDDRYSNGIYLKYANLYADSTANTRVSVFRGSSEIARENDLPLYSTWQNEMKTDVFGSLDGFDGNVFLLSDLRKLPDSWERARYVYSPIVLHGETVGICGYEISSLYTKLAYSTADTESSQTVSAILNKTDDGYYGQFISNRSGYVPPSCELITARSTASYRVYNCDGYSYVGKDVELLLGANLLTVAVMLPKNEYDSIIRSSRGRNVVLFLVVFLTALFIALIRGRRYAAPLKNVVSALKGKTEYIPSGITEIDELYVYLSDRERRSEEALAEIESQKAEMQSSLDKAKSENSEAKREIARLAYSRKTEVDPDNFAQFVEGIKTLTPMEQRVFELYVEGNRVKEIVEILDVKESTVRFHNRNIYSKLGVNSLKQLLLYASIMKGNE